MYKIIYFILLLCVTILTSNAQSITSEEDVSWYKAQTNIGLKYCGPAIVAMLIERNGSAMTIKQVEEQLPSKLTDFNGYYDMLQILEHYGIYYQYLGHLNLWNGDGVVIIFFNPELIPEITYEYNGGHYSLIVGIHDDKYIVNDPYVGSPTRYYSISAVNRARYSYVIWIP